MNKSISLLTVFISLIIFSCIDDDIIERNGDIRVTASFPESRLYFVDEDSVVRVNWNKDDEIRLVTDKQFNLTYIAQYEGSITEFTPATISDKLDYNNDKVYAYYPYYSGSQSKVVQLPWTNTQNYVDGPGKYDFIYASSKIEGNELNFQFKHIFAFLEIVLPVEILLDTNDERKRGLKISSTEDLCNSIAFFDLEKEELMKETEVNQVVYIIPSDSVLENKKEISCYVAILPQSKEAKIEISLYANTFASSENIDNGKSGDLLIKKPAPEGGFKAGNVYTIYLDENQSLQERELELDALRALYDATDGDNWKDNTNWLSNKPLNQWYGIRTHGPENRVYYIDLQNNNLNGYIPDEIGNLKDLTSLWLNDNELTGTIPDTLFRKEKMESLFLQNNKLEGELPEKINMPFMEYLYLNNNMLTGTLPTSWVEQNSLRDFRLHHNKLRGVITDEMATSEAWLDRWPVEMIYYQQDGYGFDNIYESTDFSKDGTVITLQTHSKGNGVKVVFTGEGFSDRLIDSGYFEKEMREAMEMFFLAEPFKTFREYFDIYAYAAISKNEIIGENTIWGFDIDRNRLLPALNDRLFWKVISTLKTHSLLKEEKDLTVGLVLNTNTNFGGKASMRYDGEWGVGQVDKSNDFGTLVIHEICGHTFGGFQDEQVSSGYEDRKLSDATRKAIREYYHPKGTYLNLDITNDPDSVLWAPFLKDERYRSEGLSIVEGAMYNYGKGVYRASLGGVMHGDLSFTGKFNAQCRWVIYQRIMKLAGEEYSFESFLEYDAVNRAYYDSLPTDWLQHNNESKYEIKVPYR